LANAEWDGREKAQKAQKRIGDGAANGHVGLLREAGEKETRNRPLFVSVFPSFLSSCFPYKNIFLEYLLLRLLRFFAAIRSSVVRQGEG